MMFTDNTEDYTAMLPFLNQACFGSYLILPFQFSEDDFRFEWADSILSPRDIMTVDISETARSMMSCWYLL